MTDWFVCRLKFGMKIKTTGGFLRRNTMKVVEVAVDVQLLNSS